MAAAVAPITGSLATASLTRNERVLIAQYLLRAGLRSPIVRCETGLPPSTVRDLARDVNGGKRASSGPLPSSAYLIENRVALLEASLWAAIYLRIGGEKICETGDVFQILHAHRLYMRLREQFPERQAEAFNATKVWVLARDLRSDMAWIHRCGNCRVNYIVVEDQKIPAGCPICDIR